MLPGYISYYMGAKASFGKAITSGFVCVLGLLTVFSVIGIIVSLLGSFISRYALFLELIVGLIITFMGFITLIGIRLPSSMPFLKAPRRRGFVSIYLYGLLYGLAVLGCSAPIFLSVLFYALGFGGLSLSLILFVFYTIGMGLPLIMITILIAEAKDLILKKMAEALTLLNKISGVTLILVGAYLLYYFAMSYAA